MKLIPTFVVITGIILTLSVHTNHFNSYSATDETESLSFSKDVFPIIQKNCLPCHAQAERNMSRLFMDNYDLFMKGGYNGSPVKPGNARESFLIEKINPDPPFGERMPMRSKEYLSDEEIDIFIRWINEGAKNN
jgi:hypothetical protein